MKLYLTWKWVMKIFNSIARLFTYMEKLVRLKIEFLPIQNQKVFPIKSNYSVKTVI